jgi:hypothetical protein
MYVTLNRAEIGPLCEDCYFDLIRYGIERADVIAVPIYNEADLRKRLAEHLNPMIGANDRLITRLAGVVYGVAKPFDLAALEEWLKHGGFSLTDDEGDCVREEFTRDDILDKIAELKGKSS